MFGFHIFPVRSFDLFSAFSGQLFEDNSEAWRFTNKPGMHLDFLFRLPSFESAKIKNLHFHYSLSPRSDKQFRVPRCNCLIRTEIPCRHGMFRTL